MTTRLYSQGHRYTVSIDKPPALDGDDLYETMEIAMDKMDDTVDEDSFCGGTRVLNDWYGDEPALIELHWDDPFPVETILQCIDTAINIMIQAKREVTQ